MEETTSPDVAVLSDEQRALLTVMLNCLVPAHAGVPGAGDLGVTTFIEQTLGQTAAGRRLLIDGLAMVTRACARYDGADFASRDADDQEALLGVVEAAWPLGMASLVNYTYRGYYTHPRVLAALAFTGAPALPRGHELPVFDEALLAKQRERAPFWRPDA